MTQGKYGPIPKVSEAELERLFPPLRDRKLRLEHWNGYVHRTKYREVTEYEFRQLFPDSEDRRRIDLGHKVFHSDYEVPYEDETAPFVELAHVFQIWVSCTEALTDKDISDAKAERKRLNTLRVLNRLKGRKV